MVNLETEAAIIAHAIDKPFDFPLKRRLIAAIVSGRARLIRDSLTSNKMIPNECIQSFAVPIVKAESFSLYYCDDYKVSVKTVEPIPHPIRINQDTSFISVTSLDGSINFTEADITTLRFNSNAGKFVEKTGRYIYHAERIACYHNEGSLLTMPMILIRGIMENPLLVKDYSGAFSYSETNFPMPLDMAIYIRELIRKGDIAIPPTDKTVPINDN